MQRNREGRQVYRLVKGWLVVSGVSTWAAGHLWDTLRQQSASLSEFFFFSNKVGALQDGTWRWRLRTLVYRFTEILLSGVDRLPLFTVSFLHLLDTVTFKPCLIGGSGCNDERFLWFCHPCCLCFSFAAGPSQSICILCSWGSCGFQQRGDGFRIKGGKWTGRFQSHSRKLLGGRANSITSCLNWASPVMVPILQGQLVLLFFIWSWQFNDTVPVLKPNGPC